jgi:long-chain acyl-CoA synthetase
MPADSILGALRRGADAGASLRVVGEGDQPLTEVIDQIEDLARGLVAAGLEPGDRVGMALPNGTDAILWFYAVIAAGGCTVFIPAYAKPPEVRAYAEKARTRWVIGSASDADRFLTADQARSRFAPVSGVELPEPEPDWEASCFTTSGSTGTPKLASLTHGAWAAQTEVALGWTGMEPGETTLFPLPLCHVAMITSMHSYLVHGGRVVHQTAFDALAAVELCREESVAFMSGSPAIYGLILRRCTLRDPRLRLRRVSYGAGAMPADWAAGLGSALRCEVVHCYGLTEAGGLVSVQPPQEHATKAGSVGKPLAPFDPYRVRAQDDERDCAIDEVGEVLVRGPSCLTGYVGDPEETAKVLVDGWVRTGDLGRLDPAGDLWLVGRLKDQINRGGLKVGAREVEAVIESLEGVTGVGVVGIPDPVLQERVAAVVEAVPDAVDAERVRCVCAERLADHKVPERIVILAEMPRTSLGKPDKPAMRRLLAG